MSTKKLQVLVDGVPIIEKEILGVIDADPNAVRAALAQGHNVGDIQLYLLLPEDPYAEEPIDDEGVGS